MNVCFSILHFGNFEITEECVDALLLIDEIDKSSIVIVDNGTNNGSLEKINNKYGEIGNIHVISNKENLGFAKGNNVGYVFAKERVNANVICVINNDVLIKQRDFIARLTKCIGDNPVEIIAPAIIDSRGSAQNPLRYKELSTSNILNSLFINLIMSIVYLVPVINRKAANFLEKRRLTKVIALQENAHYNIVPHGAAIIYTDQYIMREKIAFIENTFLFGEEDFLFEYVKAKGYEIRYCPELVVYHNEDSSIKAITKDYVEKRRFISTKKIKSLVALLKYRKKLHCNDGI